MEGQMFGATSEEVRPDTEFVRVLGDDYTTKSLLHEITLRHQQVVVACQRVVLFEQYTRHLADAMQNYGVTVNLALDEQQPLTQHHMRALARHALLQAKQAHVIADDAQNQSALFNSLLEDVDRLTTIFKALIQDYPQQPN